MTTLKDSQMNVNDNEVEQSQLPLALEKDSVAGTKGKAPESTKNNPPLSLQKQVTASVLSDYNVHTQRQNDGVATLRSESKLNSIERPVEQQQQNKASTKMIT